MYGKIYKIENTINHKIYIGQTILPDVLKDRYHGSLLNTHNLHLKNSILKYGIENFNIEVIDYAIDKNDLNNKEIYWISYFDSYYNGYNESFGGQLGTQTDSTIEKIRIKSKEFWDNNPQLKKELSVKYSGNNNPMAKKGGHTEESKEKMKTARKELMSRPNNIDLDKARQLSLSPESKRKQVVSSSKNWIIIYDLDNVEISRFHTLKDAYDYMNLNNYVTGYKNYKSFKQGSVQHKIFDLDLYKDKYGLIFKKVPKTNDELKNIKTEIRYEKNKRLAC